MRRSKTITVFNFNPDDPSPLRENCDYKIRNSSVCYVNRTIVSKLNKKIRPHNFEQVTSETATKIISLETRASI